MTRCIIIPVLPTCADSTVALEDKMRSIISERKSQFLVIFREGRLAACFSSKHYSSWSSSSSTVWSLDVWHVPVRLVSAFTLSTVHYKRLEQWQRRCGCGQKLIQSLPKCVLSTVSFFIQAWKKHKTTMASEPSNFSSISPFQFESGYLFKLNDSWPDSLMEPSINSWAQELVKHRLWP